MDPASSSLPTTATAQPGSSTISYFAKLPNEILPLILHMCDTQDQAYMIRQAAIRHLDRSENFIGFEPDEVDTDGYKRDVYLSVPEKTWTGASLVALASVNRTLRTLALPCRFRFITPTEESLSNHDDPLWAELGREAWLQWKKHVATPLYVDRLFRCYINLDTLRISFSAMNQIFGTAGPLGPATAGQRLAYAGLKKLVPRITTLSIPHCRFDHLEDILPACVRLRNLDMAVARAEGDVTWRALGAILEPLSTLRSLELEGHDLLGRRAIGFALPPLQHLSLHLPNINEAAWAFIESVVPTLVHLELGTFSVEGIQTDDAAARPPFFHAEFPHLRLLRLHHLKVDHIAPILNHLGQIPSPLTHLDLTFTPVPSPIPFPSPTPSLLPFSGTLHRLHLTVERHRLDFDNAMRDTFIIRRRAVEEGDVEDCRGGV